VGIDRSEILAWLRETDPAKLDALWKAADDTRKAHVGDAVHLRGLVEISNVCVRSCAYCGIRSDRDGIERYRMAEDEIIDTAKLIIDLEFGSVVLQSGEDPGIARKWLARIVARIKADTGLAVTLSLGERSRDDLAAWRDAGADRYLLRFETSDGALYDRIHPPRHRHKRDRFEILGWLGDLGYEVGTGVMVGIPGQSFESLADDIEIFRNMDVDMIGIGPFLPHPATPLGAGNANRIEPGEQVPNDEISTLKMLALTRIACPDINIPTTTALATLSAASREHGLRAGANVIMPNLTPLKYRVLYEIYPSKAKVDESAERFAWTVKDLILAMGRTVAKGPGGRKKPGRL
jgi:biotin synthase